MKSILRFSHKRQHCVREVKLLLGYFFEKREFLTPHEFENSYVIF